MRKSFCLLLLCAAAILPCAAQRGDAPFRLNNADFAPYNTIYLKSAFLEYSNYISLGAAPVTVEFARRFRPRTSWVAGISYTSFQGWLGERFTTDVRASDFRALSLNLKLSYDINLSRRLALRAEGGFSGAYLFSARNTHAHTNVTHVFYPCGMIELNWVIRIGNRVELLLAPLIVLPSMVKVSLSNRESWESERFFESNVIPIGIGVRF